MPTIRTECVIAAPADKVWAVLADFRRYAEWNPLNTQARGEVRVGAKVAMTFLNLAGNAGSVINQTVTLVACEPGRELAWRGIVPLLFHGRHGFLLTPEGAGTRVVQTEALWGLLPAVWGDAKLQRDFKPHYEAVDRALRPGWRRWADGAAEGDRLRLRSSGRPGAVLGRGGRRLCGAGL